MNAPNFDGGRALEAGLVDAKEGNAGTAGRNPVAAPGGHQSPAIHEVTPHRESSFAAAELYAQSGDEPTSRRAIVRHKVRWQTSIEYDHPSVGLSISAFAWLHVPIAPLVARVVRTHACTANRMTDTTFSFCSILTLRIHAQWLHLSAGTE